MLYYFGYFCTAKRIDCIIILISAFYNTKYSLTVKKLNSQIQEYVPVAHLPSLLPGLHK